MPADRLTVVVGQPRRRVNSSQLRTNCWLVSAASLLGPRFTTDVLYNWIPTLDAPSKIRDYEAAGTISPLLYEFMLPAIAKNAAAVPGAGAHDAKLHWRDLGLQKSNGVPALNILKASLNFEKYDYGLGFTRSNGTGHIIIARGSFKDGTLVGVQYIDYQLRGLNELFPRDAYGDISKASSINFAYHFGISHGYRFKGADRYINMGRNPTGLLGRTT